MQIIKDIENFVPLSVEEEKDKQYILEFIKHNSDAFLRTNETAHMTSSAWLLSPDLTKVGMCYHNIYNSWAWFGGHADGNENLLEVAQQEVLEEAGIPTEAITGQILSLEVLDVEEHIKKGKAVPAHLHLNVTYLLKGLDYHLREKPDENRGVKWMTPEEALNASSEPWMVEHVYKKLVERSKHHMHD